MTLTESLVSSFILTLLASQSGRVFTHAIQAVGDTKVRDQVALSISRDLEQVRNTVNLWQVVTSNLDTNGLPLNGEMAYQPSAEMCADNTLAADLISDSEYDQRLGRRWRPGTSRRAPAAPGSARCARAAG